MIPALLLFPAISCLGDFAVVEKQGNVLALYHLFLRMLDKLITFEY